MDIVDALAAESGVACVVGAGGKKTTLYHLANRLGRAVVTATVRIPIFDEQVGEVVVTDDPESALASTHAWPLGLVAERERADRYRGYDPETVARLADALPDIPVLVKADGARTRLLKAPGDREPQLPQNADTVIPIASARVVGEPLTAAHVHRPERVASVTGRALGDHLTAEDVATVLASEEGGLKDLPDGTTAIPLVNMVDDTALESVGREIAAAVLARCSVPRVVLSQMTATDPLVAVVER
ncbi:selenium cofactor biosynthesis protein YqeC [Haladaptatus sp. YSMS36]|uniref:selenium cofactor biosynthesis protein YqeC n=1 Tax=Haladaptatus sp. YSMS36 TaxID=3033384 RepID=UPI0023E760FB|nr:selenium cofactor biosynthesis protein YqeC [Haladaptatus sp. YSMS36]